MKKKLPIKRTVLITGASGDIGMACSEAYMRAGYRVIMHAYRNVQKIEQFKQKYPKSEIIAVQANGASESDVQGVFTVLRKQYGIRRIDVLINNAGDLIRRQPFAGMDWQYMQELIDVNIKPSFLFTRFVLPYLGKGSAVIFMSSMTGRAGKGDRSSAYGMAKGAILGLMKSLANELGRSGIRVNALAPGYIKGQFHKRYTKKEVELEHARKNPLQRVGLPQDVAAIALMLGENRNGYVNGNTVDINGGDYMV